MRIKRLLYLIPAAALFASCVSCARPHMPEPADTFDSTSDYQAWTLDEGYKSGAFTDSATGRIDPGVFRTKPGMAGYDSGRIVIGDSRCCQLGMYSLRAGGDGYAVFAVWGGHYTDDYPIIPDDGFYGEVEACFRAQVSAKGRCELCFFATVNDYDHVSNNNAANIAAAIECAERLASMKCAYNGGEVSPTVTVIGIEGCGSGGIRYGLDPDVFNTYIEDYNAELGKAVLASGLLSESARRYTTVPEIMHGAAGFIDDGLHYDDRTLKTLAEFILS